MASVDIINTRSDEVDPATLTLHPQNPRQGDVGLLTTLYQDNGFYGRVVIDERTGYVLAGNHRVKAALALSMPLVPVEYVQTRDDDHARRIMLADNRASDLATNDEVLLAELLEGLAQNGGLQGSGFDGDDLDELLASLNGQEVEAPEPRIDEAEVLRERWGVVAGQLWTIGRHRLLCGDATNADDVAMLMDGQRAEACITDPPYSVNYDRSQELRGGNMSVHAAYNEADIDPSALLTFMSLVPSDVMIWSYPIDRHFQTLASAYDKYGWELRKELVWIKDTFSFWMGAKYQQRHEPIMVATRKGKPMGGNIPSNATTVLEFARPKAHDRHPTAKPIGLWALFVKYHIGLDGNVYDPFLGSGSTMVAAEQLGRQCFGVEISPVYVAVTLERLSTMGLEPVLA